MDLDFTKMPRFSKDSMKIWKLIPEWSLAHQVEPQAIISQLYTAHAWIESNPKKAPKRLITRFLHSWMAQAKRYGNLKVKAEPWKPAPPEPEGDMTIEELQEIRRKNMPQYRADPQRFPGAIDTNAEEIKNV